AHDKGIVHRDIKPDNVFLAADALGRRQPKLLDFGIAKVDKQVDGRLTQVGAVLGSPDYMSPEQALGLDDIDERTDIWSLCVVLYEIITGTVPFQKPNYNALMHAVINEDPTPTIERGAGDKSLWQIIERGLRKQREDRFQSATELGEAMALWLYEHGVKEDLSGNSIRAVWLDAALTQDHRDARAARAGTFDSVSAPRLDLSRPPTAAAMATTGADTRPRTAARARSRRRALYVAGPLVALLFGVLAARLVFSSPPASLPAPAAVAPVAAALRAPALEAEPTTPPEVEAAPVVVTTAKASGSAPAKPKARAPAARKRGHDFGF
ncbi:MAG TPA: serine/threonine-protein kinase, partial [Polyangiaceae bacterium]|nr:serine/threonine-protein kinase [Polyangiaceae bacterium]